MMRGNKQKVILIADDDEDDRLLIKDAFGCNPGDIGLHFVQDGQQLLDYLYHRGSYADPLLSPLPDIILLDLNMPVKDGRETLREMKSNPALRSIPVIVLTTSSDEMDILKAYHLGANSYVVKPMSFDGLVTAMKSIAEYWFRAVCLPVENPGIRITK